MGCKIRDLMIEVDDIGFSYPDGRAALSGVTFRVGEGETVGLIGPNGAGKSTLLLHLNGLLGLPRSRGRIRIGGVDVVEEHLSEVRRQAGLLFQDPDDQIFCPSVREDVAFGPEQLGLDVTEVRKRVVGALEAVGLCGYEDRVPHHLSLGEKRRVSLAGVLACEARLLLLDEPTANFDPRGRREFIALCRRLPMTKVIATHDLEMVLALCGRVLLMDAGQLICEGAAREVLGNEPLMLRHGLEKPHSLFHHHPHLDERPGV
jgi:energy-coupling factor transporter ATP-binding protein EcfA2